MDKVKDKLYESSLNFIWNLVRILSEGYTHDFHEKDFFLKIMGGGLKTLRPQYNAALLQNRRWKLGQ